jgi:hypothetical protein
MHNNLILALLLVLMNGPTLLGQEDPAYYTKAPIDSFRGFPWGVTEGAIRTKYASKELTEADQPSDIRVLGLHDELMFGIKGDIWFTLKKGSLIAGSWQFPNQSKRAYWIGRHVLRRDVEVVLALLEEKYGLPRLYRINGTLVQYRSRDKVFADYGEVSPTNHVDLWWRDANDNVLSFHLRADLDLMVVNYQSSAAQLEVQAQEDH